MKSANRHHDSKRIPPSCFIDDTRILLQEWFSLPTAERDRKFISTTRAAEIARVSRQTIRAWVEIGEVQALRIGRKLYVYASSLRNRIELRACSFFVGETRQR